MTSIEQRSGEAARRAMIDSQLRTSGVNEPWVLAAMAALPREDFVPEAMRAAAYIDRAVPLSNGRFLAAPLVQGRMLAEAAPTEADHALLVGDGEGYLAALPRPLVSSLDAIDPADAAKKRKPYVYIPFGGGKRSCIGGAMSQVENTFALSMLMRRFRPEYMGNRYTPAEEHPGINATVTLTPRGGLNFRIHELS